MTAEKISDIRETMGGMIERYKDLPQVEMPLTHLFCDGIYIREIFMPAGTLVIGEIHKTEHFNVLLSGEVTIFTIEGVERVSAPHRFISQPGIQKVLLIHVDCIWQTVHATESKNVPEIEKTLISETYDDLINDELMKKALEVSE